MIVAGAFFIALLFIVLKTTRLVFLLILGVVLIGAGILGELWLLLTPPHKASWQ